MAKKTKRTSKKITEQLRAAIAASGETRSEIARATGVANSQLSFFMSGKRVLGGDAIDRICTHLGLELTEKD